MSKEVEITSSHTACGQLKHYGLTTQTKDQLGFARLCHMNGLSLQKLYLDYA